MRELYLIRHGETQPAECVTDPHSAELRPSGVAQARALGAACEAWQIEYLAASTTLHAQQTTDIIHARLPRALRRDMHDLEDVTLDDLTLDPTASSRPASWTPAQREVGLSQAWTRVTAALARVQVYCERNAVTRVGIVAGQEILGLVLVSYLGLDRHADDRLVFQLDPGSTTRLSLLVNDRVRVEWVNRRP